MTLRLSQIYIYPVKSLGGIKLETADIHRQGLKWDRKWMLVDENGVFLSQRTYPKMTLLKVAMEGKSVKVTDSRTSSALTFPLIFGGKRTEVSVWNDVCQAEIADKAVNEWFSDALGMNCRLVRMPDDETRLVDRDYAKNGETVNFPDAFPFLLIGQASLDLLNQKLERPITMDRFRPNLVFSGGSPFEEDKWENFQVGEAVFRTAKPCARCTIPTVDPATGETGKEPLKTLALFRKWNNKILFGQNLLCERGSVVSVGDEVKIGKLKSETAL